jgi:hypothetical protein
MHFRRAGPWSRRRPVHQPSETDLLPRRAGGFKRVSRAGSRLCEQDFNDLPQRVLDPTVGRTPDADHPHAPPSMHSGTIANQDRRVGHTSMRASRQPMARPYRSGRRGLNALRWPLVSPELAPSRNCGETGTSTSSHRSGFWAQAGPFSNSSGLTLTDEFTKEGLGDRGRRRQGHRGVVTPGEFGIPGSSAG